MNPAPAPRVPWDSALMRCWRKLGVTLLAALGVASTVWQAAHLGIVYDFVFRADAISPASEAARRAFLPLVGAAFLVAALIGARVLRQARRGQTAWTLHRELLLASLMAVPVLVTPGVEFEHPVFTALLVALISLAFAWTVAKETGGLPALRDLSPRQAQLLVGAGYLTFVLVIGFIAHWRFITFHAEVCDASWEIGAVAGILRHGIPTVSVAAWLYDGKPLPQPYFNDHVPLVDYLFVPFYLVYRNPRILFWVQAAFMGAGAFGAQRIGRRWLASRAGGVLAAGLYLLTPSVQGFCLHDIHANIFVIPALLLAVGFMEDERPRIAFAFALLTAVCREEAPLFAACLGLYWMFSGEDRRRFRFGLATLVIAVALQAFFAVFLMPHFGGQPRWDHFNLFFLPTQSPATVIGAVVLNPLGAAFASLAEVKLDYLAICLVPLGGVALLGWRAGWFLLPTLLLLVPAGDPGFFSLGNNYSAPLVPAAILMGLAGLRRLWQRSGADDPRRRAGLATYVLVSALLANYLYGDIASKSYKLEIGQAPFRRENQHDYHDIVAYVDALPPFGPAERALWDVIDHVPKNAPILTSWSINPQLSDRDVALTFGYSGGNPAPEDRVRYVVIDKLPTFQMATENEILRFRADPRWTVFYENNSGIIFERRAN